MVTVEYRCPDGTPFPVEFESEEDAAKKWRFDRSHVTHPQTPLAAELLRMGHPGVARAYEECGLPSPPWRPGITPFGFSYGLADPPDIDRTAFVEGCRVLIEKYGGAGGIWTDLNLPIVRRECEWLQAAGPEAGLQELTERQQYAWAHTMISILVSGNDIELLTATIKDLYGDGANVVAFELTQGYPNETVQADAELWRLGQMVQDSAELRQALSSPAVREAMQALRATGAEPAFFDALHRFLDTYGARAEEWDISVPTWQEQGDGFWNQIRQMARRGIENPADVLEKAAKRREQLIGEIDARLTDDDTRARFHRRVGRLRSYVAVREERALWQLISTGALRGALLRRGAALVERGALTAPDDILYLVTPEVEAAERGEGDWAALAAERRAERDRWMPIEPPAVIGGDPAAVEAAPVLPDDGVLTGEASARGEATGAARVVTELADADRVEPGDVLVCHMTSPPWTPLFAVAAAVVCEHGFPGSHAAIASREYGIPCVSIAHATRLIPDGASVTVDGGAGTVTVQR